MPRKKTPADIAAGQLVLAVQKVQNEHAGTEKGYEADAVLQRAHELHMAAVSGSLQAKLNGRNVMQYLGPQWVMLNPQVLAYIATLEAMCEV